MKHASATTEISGIPDLARLAHEVAESGEARLLTEHGETIAVLSPAPAKAGSSYDAQVSPQPPSAF